MFQLKKIEDFVNKSKEEASVNDLTADTAWKPITDDVMDVGLALQVTIVNIYRDKRKKMKTFGNECFQSNHTIYWHQNLNDFFFRFQRLFFEGYSCDVLDISCELKGLFEQLRIDESMDIYESMEIDVTNSTIGMDATNSSMESTFTLTEERPTRDEAMVALFANTMLVSARYPRPSPDSSQGPSSN